MKSFVFSSSLIVFTFLAADIFGREENEEFVTDRPDQTESSRTVPSGAWQIETGITHEIQTSPTIKILRTLYPTTLLRIGILPSVELRIADQFIHSVSNGTSSTELDNLALGFKANLCTENNFRPEIAVMGHLTFPLGAGVSSHQKILPDIKFSLSHTLSSTFDLGYNLGWEADPQASGGNAIYSITTGVGFDDCLGAYIEAFGSLVNMRDLQSTVDGGITYLITPNFQVDVSSGIATDNSSHYFSAGASLRLPR